ncbi:RING finger protein 208-like [Anguilla rostrata]|uniref:RING finger protein 208-like n=1 Tax=Anguilla rostrata TaxID=7938 RepID=UPI0030D1669E
MVVCEEDRECGVCYQAYTRSERVPRLLHCSHVLCTLCLERMSRALSSLLAVRCPFCRWTTCVGPNLSLQEGLWVHTELWDQISEHEDKNEEEREEEEEKSQGQAARQVQLTQQSKWSSLKSYKLHLEVPPILKRLSNNLQRTFQISHQTCSTS